MAAKYILSNSAEGYPGSSSLPPPTTTGGGSRESSASSITSTGSHRNRQLLKSYHDLAMHVFSNNKATQEAERLFLAAVREGDYERVENFLKRRNHEVVDIDIKDLSSGDTPLIAACRNGFNKVVQLLLKFGADTTLRNYEGETAVSVASVPIRKLLLESVERSGCSHRHLLQAAWQGNVGIVQRLLKEGKFLDINCENADGFTPLLLVTRDILVFEKVKSLLKDYSPDGVVKILLAQRADPTMSDSEGKTAMHHAAACPSAIGHQITVMLMKDKELMVAQDENCVAPIHIASKCGQVDTVIALLDEGVDINSRGHAGATPLHVSASAGQLNVANTLLNRGADVTLVDDRGNTPMDVAHGKKMRSKLKEAWTEVTHNRRGSTPVLSPVKAPSRKEHRRHSSSEDTSPRDVDAPMSLTTNRVLQKLKDAHRALLNENQVLRDIDNGRFTPSSLTSTKLNLQKHTRRRSVSPPSGSPPKQPSPPKTTKGGDVHSNLHPAGQQTRRTLSHDDKTSKVKGVKGHQKLAYSLSDPVKGNRRYDKAAIPVAVVGLDWDENVQDIRYGRVNQGRQLQQKGIPPTADIPKRLALDMSSNPSLQEVTDICSGYLKKGSKPSLLNGRDSQQSLPEVSPNRPISGAYRSVFFDGNHAYRATPSPFMERLHGFLGTTLPPQGHQVHDDVIADCDEERKKTISVMSVDSPVSPQRSVFTNSPFTGSSEVVSGSVQQRPGPLAAPATFHIELSRVNQLKESSDSGQGSSRSTNSRASTISTPSPLLGDIEGSPSRHQAGLKRSLHLQSIDGDSGVHLPSLAKDKRTDRIQTLEDRNFRLINGHQRHNSEDAMSVVSVSSSITVKTADICGQRISLSHTLKEESEVGSSPEQSLRDPGKMKELVHSQLDRDKLKDRSRSHIDSQKIKMTCSEGKEKMGGNVSKMEQIDEKKVTARSSHEEVTDSGNGTRHAHSSQPIKSNNVTESVKSDRTKAVIGESKANGIDSQVTKEVNKAKEKFKQLNSNNLETGLKEEKKTHQTKEKDHSKMIETLNKNTPRKEILKEPSSGIKVEKKGQQTLQLKNVEEVNKGKKVMGNKMETLPAEKTSKEKGASVITSGESDKGRTIKEKEKSMNVNKKDNLEVKDAEVSKDGKGATLSKVVPSLQKPVQTTGPTEKQVQEKERLQKANSKAPPVIKQPIKTSNSFKDKSAIESKKMGESGVSSPRKVTDKSRALNNSGQSGRTGVGKAGSQGGTSPQRGSLDKSRVKGHDGVALKVEKSERGGVTHKEREKESMKKGIVSTGGKKDVESSSSRSEKSKIPQRQENKESLKRKVNTSVNKSKENSPKLPQRNTPRERKTPVSVPKAAGTKMESLKTGTAVRVPLTTESIPEERNSGKSQGSRSTPTDVTSDLTSDLHSRDSDSIESIEDVLDEVMFSSSSENEEDKLVKATTENKLSDPPVRKVGKPGTTVLDPAVVITKSVDNNLKHKSTNFSPKSPKTPKKGATGAKKFIFKSVENSGGKKNSGKSVPGTKQPVNVKLNSSKVSTQEKTKERKSTESTENNFTKENPRQSALDKEKSSNVEKEKSCKGMFDDQQHTPVIIDIRDDLPKYPAGSDVIGDIIERSPKLKKKPSSLEKKKSTLQQLSQKISRGSAKTSNLVERASKGVKSVHKSNKSGKINSNAKEPKMNKEGVKSPSKVKKGGVKSDLRIMSDSESSNTAFITGQGWEIKTSCNESNGVIIQDQDTNTTEQSLCQRKLSPANSLKIDFLAKRTPMSPQVINNIANIMSPLEIDTPKFMPDTMDTIKEFAGSLSSVEEEKAKAVFTFSPVGSPTVSQKHKKGSKTPGKQSNLVKSVSPLKEGPETPGSAFLPPPPTEDIPSFTSDCKTNPDLLKVFCIPNHFDSTTSSPRSTSPPTNGSKIPSSNVSKDKKDLMTDEKLKVSKPAIENRRKSIHQLQKTQASSKFGLSKSFRKYLKRRQSAPTELQTSDDDSSDTDSCASSFKNQMRLLADISDVASEDGSSDGRVSSRGKGTAPGGDENDNNQRDREKDGKREEGSDKDVDGLKSTSKEQLLTEHVQTISIKTLQELNTILSNSEEAPITSPLAPPLSSRPISRESTYSRPKSRSSLNQSLPLSEAAEGLDLNFLDSFRQDSHLSGELANTTGRVTTLSSATSGDRSHSQNTNFSEGEGELLHWKKGNVLGKGAFGTVFCGLTNTGQLIAVKQVELTEKRQAGEQYEKLQEEVELLKTLRHKNIVGFLGVSLEETVVNIFMQYVPGGSIASLLARFGALEEPVFCRYTQQVVEGTVYLHSNNVIHRDIKGANIMLMSNGVIKLIDFGCAKRLCIQISQSQNLLKSMKGTPYWMAPEVIMETGHGTKSDVWSIGCTVMEMATRKPPWADMPPMSAIFAIGSGGPVPQLSDKFTTAARDFVDLCLTRNPDERATSLELLQHPFLKQRKERRRDSRLLSRTSLSNFEEGIMFKEQPILKDTTDSSRKKTIFGDFK